jgi:hypothetical protein
MMVSNTDEISIDILLAGIQEMEFPENYNKYNINILILDDNAGVLSIIEDDLLMLELDEEINMGHINIFQATTEMGAFIVTKFLLNHPDIIFDMAILDLTIGDYLAIKESGFSNVKLDGVDIAIKLFKANNDIKLLFHTGHSMNNRHNLISEYINKFANNTGLNINDYILPKGILIEERRKILKNEINTITKHVI